MDVLQRAVLACSTDSCPGCRSPLGEAWEILLAGMQATCSACPAILVPG